MLFYELYKITLLFKTLFKYCKTPLFLNQLQFLMAFTSDNTLKYKQMKSFRKYARFIPYLYFISVVIYWFIDINQNNGITSYLILTLGLPFLWQILRPNKSLNFTLGIIFICLSSYLILAFLSDIIRMSSFNIKYLLYGSLFVFANFIMSMWIIRNSLNRTF